MNMSLRAIRSAGAALLVVFVSLLTTGVSLSAHSGGSFALSLAGQAGNIALNPKHPERYVVKRGDTLWDISALFLRDPWYWPEIWQVNPQVENPHLIYPGDILTLVYVDGQPQIQLERSAESGGADRLSPRIREEDLDEAITTIPLEAVGAFLSKGSILQKDEIKNLPHIAAIREGHLVGAAGNDVYVRGDIGEINEGYSVIHVGNALVDPDDNEVLGYRGIFVGEGVIRRLGDPATLHLIKSQREALEGDRLVKQNFHIPLQFYPRVPEQQVDGRIIDVVDGMTVIGQYQVVVLNRGTNHGLDVGHVLTVWQAGQVVKDRFSNGFADEKILLPDEEAATLMVFKTYDRVSYALIMEATTEIHILDKVRNPV